MNALISDASGPAVCCECRAVTTRPVRVRTIHSGAAAEHTTCPGCAGDLIRAAERLAEVAQ